jgi:hypothetical protein
MSLNRLARGVVVVAIWYVLAFIVGDAVWQHFAHHEIPLWAEGIRVGLWFYALIRDKLPGYSRFVGSKGARSSHVVPETPTAPLVGWRAWRSGDGTGLRSLTSSAMWPTGKPMRSYCIRCDLSGHRSPCPGCECGLYVFAGPSDASVIRLSRRTAVYGPVLTWGRTQEHETGWRSEYARPLALVRPRILSRRTRARVDGILDRLGREYGVPVLSLKEAKALADRMAQQRGA